MGKDYLVIMFKTDCDTHLGLRNYRQVTVSVFKARKGYRESLFQKPTKEMNETHGLANVSQCLRTFRTCTEGMTSQKRETQS